MTAQSDDLPFSLMDDHGNIVADYSSPHAALEQIVRFLENGQRAGVVVLRLIEFTDDDQMHLLMNGEDLIREAEKMRHSVFA